MITHLLATLQLLRSTNWVLIVKGCTWKQKQPFLFLWNHMKKSKVGKRKNKGWRKKSPRCTLCTYYRWLGNSKGRKRHSYYRQQQAAWPHSSTTTSSRNITSKELVHPIILGMMVKDGQSIPSEYAQGLPHPQNLSVSVGKGSLFWKFSGGSEQKNPLDTSTSNLI